MIGLNIDNRVRVLKELGDQAHRKKKLGNVSGIQAAIVDQQPKQLRIRVNGRWWRRKTGAGRNEIIRTVGGW